MTGTALRSNEDLRRELTAQVDPRLRSLEHVARDILNAWSGVELEAIRRELYEWNR